MRVLHVIPGICGTGGGPSRSSQGLVAALCKLGVDAWLYPFDNADPWIPGVHKFTQTLSTQTLKHFDLVHIHGIWDPRLHKAAVMCRKAGVPYVIAPRGMLEPWSLKQKWLKKRIARWLYQDRDLKLAAALHATAESEAEQFRRLGFKNKIIVSPNGVNVPEGTIKSKSGVEVEQRTCRRALFVSRMHPKKGVLELVESWARVKNGRCLEDSRFGGLDGWACELVYTMNSEEERAYEQKVKRRVLELGMTYGEMAHGALSVTSGKDSASPLGAVDFIFTGALDDEKKWEAYARADLFVLPTYSENFGIVVAEALWAGVPVITTKGAPWAELEERKCGWWIDLPVAEVKVEGQGLQWKALDSALREAMVRKDLREMGARGRKLVAERYTWPAVCDRMIKGYEEALNGRA